MKKTSHPLITVCIANYNGRDVIGPCLESVYSQEGTIPIEIIVHDDASTDSSAEYIIKNYPDVKLIKSSENVGFCTSNNRMAEQAESTYILLLNNDAVLHKDALITLYDYSTENNYTGILGLPQYDIQTGNLIDIGSMFDPFLNPVPNHDPMHHDAGLISGACLWIPKQLWDEIGGFPDRFFFIAEDTYLCCIARLWSFPVQALNESGFDHWIGKNIGGGRVESGKLSTTYKRRYHSERNKSSVMFVCYPLPLLCIILPIHLILLILEGILVSVLKKDCRVWKEIYALTFISLWYDRRRLIKDRGMVQQRRKASVKDFTRPFTWFPHKARMLFSHGLPSLR